ncbi:MAG: PQQ-binding-like beta-propeller repeat protein [Pseudomonadota bacterium]
MFKKLTHCFLYLILILILILIIVLSSCTSISRKDGFDKWLNKQGLNVYIISLWVNDLNPKPTKVKDFVFPREFASGVLTQDFIIVGASNGTLSAFERNNGKSAWSFNTFAPIDMKPLIYDDKIFIANIDGRIVCLNLFSGKLIWEKEVGSSIFSKGAIGAHGKIVLFHLANNYLLALNAEDGNWLWSVKKDINIDKTIKGNCIPVVKDSKVYVGFADGNIEAFNIADGASLWSKKLSIANKFLDIDTEIVFYKDNLIVSTYSGELFSVNEESQFINWKFKSDDQVIVAVSLFEDFIFVSTLNGNIYCINASTGEQKWLFTSADNFRFNQGSPGKVSLINDMLIVAYSKGGILLIEKETGKVIENYKVGSGISSDIVVDEDSEINEFYFLSNFSRLYALKLRNTQIR